MTRAIQKMWRKVFPVAPCGHRDAHVFSSGCITCMYEAADASFKDLFHPEIVICAAVKATDGRIFRCHRHHHGFAAIRIAGATRLPGAEAQGFITSRGRFVTRPEGRTLQDAAGIESIAPGGYRSDRLYSEDVY